MEKWSPDNLKQTLSVDFDKCKSEEDIMLINKKITPRIAYEKPHLCIDNEEKIWYKYFVHRWNCKRLVKINLSDFSREEIELPMKHTGWPSVAMYEIPNKGIFCLGSRKEGYIFLIHPDYSIETIASRHNLSGSSSAVYYDGFIYLFGGVNKRNEPQISERYNFKENRWEVISSSLAYLFTISGFGYNQKIIFHQENNDLLDIYDIRTESYSEVQLPLIYKEYRNLFRISSSAFLFEVGFNLLEINIEDLYDGRWRILGNFSPCMSLIGFPTYVDNSIYFLFLMPTFSLYKFDFATKSIVKVRNYDSRELF